MAFLLIPLEDVVRKLSLSSIIPKSNSQSWALSLSVSAGRREVLLFRSFHRAISSCGKGAKIFPSRLLTGGTSQTIMLQKRTVQKRTEEGHEPKHIDLPKDCSGLQRSVQAALQGAGPAADGLRHPDVPREQPGL